MRTCEQCGADAVDARGICKNCGWHAADGANETEGLPSLGQTRAAEVPNAPLPSRPPSMISSFGQASAAPSRPLGGGAPATSRFCGTCGARIEGGQSFCGQCGSPVSASGGGFGTSRPSAAGSGRYDAPAETWGVDGNAPTEFAPEIHGAGPYARSGLQPYGAPQFGPQHYTPAPASSGSGRGVRITFGVLCLLGSIASAVAAILIATSS